MPSHKPLTLIGIASLLTLTAIGFSHLAPSSVARLSGAWARPSRIVPTDTRRGS